MVNICLYNPLSPLFSNVRKHLNYLFSGTDAAIDFVDQTSPNHLEQNKAGSRVKHLFVSRTIAFILEICMGTRTFPVHPNTHYIGNVDFSQP